MLLLSSNSKSKLFNRTQTTNILLLPTSRNLLTRLCASSKTTDSFFLGFSSKYKHTRLFFLSSLVQQLNDHQAFNEISFLIILSMCEGNYLQISQEIHTQQKQSNLKNVARVFLLYLRQNIKPYMPNSLRLSWKFYRKNNLRDFRLIESNSRSTGLDRIAHSILQ